jgi:hypothetical protein
LGDQGDAAVVLPGVVAIHEAGHAVAGVLLRRRFDYVTIVPDDDSLGHCAFPSEFHRIQRMIEGGANKRDDARLRLCILTGLAGSAAEERAFGTHQLMDEHDGETAVEIADLLVGGPDETGPFLDQAWSEVQDLWAQDTHWAAVVRVADVLRERKRLNYRTVRCLVVSYSPSGY